MTPHVTATDPNPTHHITLSDGTNTVPLMLADARGKAEARAIKRVPYPRQSTKISQTNNKYSDLEPPYYSIPQDDWSGGRGSLMFEEDTTRYMDNFRAWADQEKQVTCGPQETYCQNYGAAYRQNFQSMPGKVEFTALMGANAYLAHKFTTVAAITTSKLSVIIKKVGTPDGWLLIGIFSDNGGSPGSLLASALITTSNITDRVSILREAACAYALSAATSYWVEIYQATGTPTTANHWEVGTNPDIYTSTKKSADGASWSAASQELYYRVIDNNECKFKFFEYKRAVYVVDTTNGNLFLNGDRGAADDNSGDKTYLNDATKSWSPDEWSGCIVLITKGPGATDSPPWRTIAFNDAHSLKVTPAWDTAHTTETEYVILGSNKWTYKTAIPTYVVTDIAVADEFAYFAQSGEAVYRYNERNNAGTWTVTAAAEAIAKANKLCAINTPSGWELWGSLNNHPKKNGCVWRAKIPETFSASCDLYNLVTLLDDGKGVWDERVVSNITVTQEDDGTQVAIAAGFTTGDACSKAIPATDITRGTHVGALIKSTVATAAGDLKLKLDDTPLLKRNYLPDKILHYDAEVLPGDVVWMQRHIVPSSVYYYDDSEATDPEKWLAISNWKDKDSTAYFQLNYNSDDYIYLSSPERLQGFYIELGATKNGVAASVMTVEYWDGDSWEAYSKTDGTSSGGITLAQSGFVSLAEPYNHNKGSDYAQFSYLAQDLFHIRIKFDKALTADITLTDIMLWCKGIVDVPDQRQFASLKNAIDTAEYSTYESTQILYNLDTIYIRYNKRFNRIKFKFDALNNNLSSMAGYYWDGTAWVSASITDGTNTGTETLAQNGDITFTMPTAWQPGCDSFLAPFLSATDYIIKLTLTVTDGSFLDEIKINEITIEDDNLPEVFNWVDMNNVKDGDTATYDYLTLTADDYVYVMFASKFNKVYWTPTVFNAVASSTMAAQYFNGHVWTSLSITDGTLTGGKTLAQAGAMSFTIPHDWQIISIGENEGYAVRFYPDKDLTAGVKITELYVQNDDATSLSIPALVANQWAYVEMAITPNANPNPDDSAIVSIGLNVAVDNGAQTVTIGVIELITEALDYFKLGNTRINAIEAYGDERTNPWIFTEDMIYEIQTQNDNAIVPIPLREIRALSSEINGQAHTTSNVYLVFNLGNYIEKYYQHNLDDVGPNKGEGLPANRQGDPVALLSYPGKMFLAIDAKTGGYSAVLMMAAAGWHEVYRAPYGCPIHDIYVQVIPGMNTRLWVSQEYDILWLPLPTGTWNPKNDSNFRYTHESVITTGWISCGFMDISKFWKSVKLYTENLSGTDQYIQCEYQIEDGDLESGWTAINDVFNTSPFEEQLISANYDTIARRIRFRFKFITTSNLESPILKASIVDALLRFPVKYAYTIPVILEDFPQALVNDRDMITRIEDITAIMDGWVDSPVVLTFRCPYSPYDNVRVVLEESGMKPMELDMENQVEKHVATLTLLEV
jgi:hypothetical protein